MGTQVKPVVKTSTMEQELQDEVIAVAQIAMSTETNEQEIAAKVKQHFEQKYHGLLWHCCVGRNVACYVTHEQSKFLYFYVLNDLLVERGLSEWQVVRDVRISNEAIDVIYGYAMTASLQEERIDRKRKRKATSDKEQPTWSCFLVLPAVSSIHSSPTLSIKHNVPTPMNRVKTQSSLGKRRGTWQRSVTTITTNPSSAKSDRPLPLEGIRVVECGHLIAGPFAGTILSYFGADVIKVEPPTGDQVRDYRELDSTKTSLWWYSLGRNKRSVVIDMKKEEGRKLIEELIEQSDVLIENFRPGRMEKWGLGPDHFEKTNPKLVYTRVSGFGQDGPYSSRPGFASVCEAMGGFRYVNGFSDRPPARPNLSIGDTIAGIHAALGIVIALLGRERGAAAGLSTKGQVVDVAIYESMFNLMEAVIPEYDYSGSIRECSGSTITGIVPSNTYVTKDKKNVVLAANIDSLFVRMMNAIGREDMAKDNKYRTNGDRVQYQGEIDAAIAAWTATQDLDTVVAVMEKATVPVGLVYSVEDMVNDPHYQQRGMFEEVEIPDGDKTQTLKVPAILPKLKTTPGVTQFAGRKLGQDTRQVLEDVLGRSQQEIEQLLDAEVVFEP
ncbi:Formyl-coenzyme A transferase [Phytophthora megakarya]|uniref:Dynein light chain 1, cytoplasmic n=1 Tax=Phytophthora megakarya TaxID=4795 RepID=A0A225WX61_9STRA|nr:Formyl-coenzyme A transferase [Phytophthora megakarya]